MQYYLILYMHVQNNRYINVNGGNIESVLHYFIFIYKQMKHTYISILYVLDFNCVFVEMIIGLQLYE